ncbi:lysosomal Pro-X carboxypeptidase-like [Rhopilema esculentum]|uniref:lysosomal Pro-X carboxypeptidase-like n=1 Tax=Rhopilema esculentum TaxID=499914 RepID=UPI0031E00DE2|eukprot:gene274-9923_t
MEVGPKLLFLLAVTTNLDSTSSKSIVQDANSFHLPPLQRFPRPQYDRNIYQDNNDITYETLYFEQTLDHFNFLGGDKKFWQRYLVNKQYWKEGGPIFFYTGNEGAIDWFCNNTGFMWDIAPEFGAMLVFAEHRYYGQSLPFGKDSYKDATHLGYLTSEQALADFATLIDNMKATMPGAANSPVVAFGGSYGGMLAAWFRMKYPSSVVGAISASAPILAFTGMNKCETFYDIVSQDFYKAGGTSCTSLIRKSWDIIAQYGQSAGGRGWLNSIFKLCHPLEQASDTTRLSTWLSSVWSNLAMVDYPYPAAFLEPLPAWPIKVVCSHLQNPEVAGVDLLKSISAAVNVYVNYTGEATCFNTERQAEKSLGDRGWDFQACTEQVMPLCTGGEHNIFPDWQWNFDAYAKQCYSQWGVTTRAYWVESEYGGKNLKAASNIVFSNGNLDPWSGLGVLEKPSPSVVTVMIDQGAHHLDLRRRNPNDPESVIKAREIEKANIKLWIAQKQLN